MDSLKIDNFKVHLMVPHCLLNPKRPRNARMSGRSLATKNVQQIIFSLVATWDENVEDNLKLWLDRRSLNMILAICLKWVEAGISKESIGNRISLKYNFFCSKNVLNVIIEFFLVYLFTYFHCGYISFPKKFSSFVYFHSEFPIFFQNVFEYFLLENLDFETRRCGERIVEIFWMETISPKWINHFLSILGKASLIHSWNCLCYRSFKFEKDSCYTHSCF